MLLRSQSFLCVAFLLSFTWLVEGAPPSKFGSLVKWPNQDTFEDFQRREPRLAPKQRNETVVELAAETGYTDLPTTDVDETVDRLVITFAVVIVLIAAVLALLAFWIIRLGLRPVADVADTARAVAAGDRDRRAPVLDERTEVAAAHVGLHHDAPAAPLPLDHGRPLLALQPG